MKKLSGGYNNYVYIIQDKDGVESFVYNLEELGQLINRNKYYFKRKKLKIEVEKPFQLGEYTVTKIPLW